MATATKKKVAKKKTTAKKTTAKKTVTKSTTKKTDTNKSSGTVPLVDIVQNWNKMNEHLNDLSEAKCLELLTIEQKGRCRVHMLNRIHARFTKLRSERERLAIMKGETIAA